MMKKICLIALSFSSVYTLSLDYGTVIDTFVGKSTAYPVKDFMPYVKLITIPSDNPRIPTPYHFYGVHENNQLKVNFPELKKRITTLMKIPHTNAIQIIGDSGKFSEAGTKKGRRFLRGHINRANLVEYGFTGYKSPDGKELDINSFVNEYIDERPAIAKRVLANILGHTAVAIAEWGTYGSPNVRNFVVVYNDYDMSQPQTYEAGKKLSGFTTFGNDITMSDYLLQAKDGDRFVCLEGGVQSFLQVINALKLNIPVSLVYNLRKPDRNKFFSATRYLNMIAKAYKQNNKLTKAEAQTIFDDYEKTLSSIWDPSKADYKTKKELFDIAMDLFIEGELYKKVAKLCTFIDGNTLPEKS